MHFNDFNELGGNGWGTWSRTEVYDSAMISTACSMSRQHCGGGLWRCQQLCCRSIFQVAIPCATDFMKEIHVLYV